jgi:hypothetical protein
MRIVTFLMILTACGPSEHRDTCQPVTIGGSMVIGYQCHPKTLR